MPPGGDLTICQFLASESNIYQNLSTGSPQQLYSHHLQNVWIYFWVSKEHNNITVMDLIDLCEYSEDFQSLIFKVDITLKLAVIQRVQII